MIDLLEKLVEAEGKFSDQFKPASMKVSLKQYLRVLKHLNVG